MKITGNAHLIRKQTYRRVRLRPRTACGLIFNPKSMNGTDDVNGVVCQNCQNSRYISLLRNYEGGS
jgi:hypothetical protein